MRNLFSALLAGTFAMFIVGEAAAQQRQANVTSGKAAGHVRVEVDKSAQQMVVTVDGVRRHVWPVSTGRVGHDTPLGSYRAFRLERDHFSKEWDDAPMPHSIFFTKRGHAIHGSLDTRRIGSPASAGCVRLAPEHAATLFQLVEERGVLNTEVSITGDVRVALARTGTTAARTAPAPAPVTRRSPAPRQQANVWPQEEIEPPELDAYSTRMRRQYERDRNRQDDYARAQSDRGERYVRERNMPFYAPQPPYVEPERPIYADRYGRDSGRDPWRDQWRDRWSDPRYAPSRGWRRDWN